MGRPVNEELRKLVIHLHALGYDARMMVDKIAEITGRRYSASYLRKLLWTMRKEGLLDREPSSSLWADAMDCVKAARLRVIAALDELRVGSLERAKKDLEPVPELLERALSSIAFLRRSFGSARVVR